MSGNNNNAKKPQPTTATSDFICTLKFSNNLPDLPFEPKLLTVPLDPLRLYKFQPENSLERDYKHSIIPEADLGIPLNLVDPHTFQCSPQLKGYSSNHNQTFRNLNQINKQNQSKGITKKGPTITYRRIQGK